MILLNKYSFYCKECGINFISDFKIEDEPVVCPVNPNHEIENVVVLEKMATTGPTNMWGQPMSQPYTKPTNTYDYFSGRCDDRNDKGLYGTGNKMFVSHKAGSGITKHELYFDLNCEMNRTYLHNGWILYNNCKGDSVSLEIIPEVNKFEYAENTNFILDQTHGIILPSAGAGNINLLEPDNIKPLECLVSQVSGRKFPGYWDADWDVENKKWINLRPNIHGTGNFNLIPDFGFDIVLDKFVNSLILVGTGNYFTNTFSTAQLGIGFRIKVTIETDDTHDFDIAINLFFARRYTK